MTIAGFATGCERGIIPARRVTRWRGSDSTTAIGACRERGFLGGTPSGGRRALDLELRRGAGAYIARGDGADETRSRGAAASRATSRRSHEHGLFGQPTVIKQSRDAGQRPPIVIEGGRRYAAIGTERSTGPQALYASRGPLSPGRLRGAVRHHTQRMPTRRWGRGSGRLQAILLGGAAGAFLGTEHSKLPLTFEEGASRHLGSAVVMPFDDRSTCARDPGRIGPVLRDEFAAASASPQVATVRQEERLHRLATDRPLGSVTAE